MELRLVYFKEEGVIVTNSIFGTSGASAPVSAYSTQSRSVKKDQPNKAAETVKSNDWKPVSETSSLIPPEKASMERLSVMLISLTRLKSIMPSSRRNSMVLILSL